MFRAIVVERLLLHDAHDDAVCSGQATALHLAIGGPAGRAMHVPVAPMAAGEQAQNHAQEQCAAHGAPDHLGMLLAPLAERDQALEHGHRRGLLAKKRAISLPPSTTMIVPQKASMRA